MFKFLRARGKEVQLPQRDPPAGMFQAVWERKRMPSPGAMRYAWESLGLEQFTPIGPGVATRKPIVPLPGGDQPYVGLAVRLDGIPTVAGQVVGQPLYNPGQPYGSALQPIVNVPFQKNSEPIGGELL